MLLREQMVKRKLITIAGDFKEKSAVERLTNTI